MNEEEIAKKEAEATALAEAEAKAKEEANQDPIKKELEKVQAKKGKTEAEKAASALFFNAKRAKELGLDPKAILGISDEEESDDDTPVTRGDLKKLEQENAQKTALSLAEDIDDEPTRELTKYHLLNTIRPSGNPKEDLSSARAIVDSVKNSQIAEEAMRKGKPKSASSGSGAPAPSEGEAFEPTASEAVYMRAPWSLTETQILAARKQAES